MTSNARIVSICFGSRDSIAAVAKGRKRPHREGVRNRLASGRNVVDPVGGGLWLRLAHHDIFARQLVGGRAVAACAVGTRQSPARNAESRCRQPHKPGRPCQSIRNRLATGHRPATTHEGVLDMRVLMTAVIVIALVSASVYAFGEGYNAAAAYGRCQLDALQGLHYPINGDCPNWEAWQAGHMHGQTSSHRRAYPTSRSRHHLGQ